MFEINVNAQQMVVFAVNCMFPENYKLILCHSLRSLHSNRCCHLGTYDLFRELLSENRDNFISVFPNIGSVLNMMSKHETNGFQFEVVLACHKHCDLVGLIAELTEKFPGSHKFISHVRSLCKLPEKTLEPHASLTYLVRLCSNRKDYFEMQWTGS